MHAREAADPNGGGGLTENDETVEGDTPEVVDSTSGTTVVSTKSENTTATDDPTTDSATLATSSAIESTIQVKLEPDDSSSSSISSTSDVSWRLEVESDASMRKRLFTSLSQSFPGSALSRVLHSMDTMPLDSDDEDLASPDKLSSSCFAEIRLDKGEMDDDELTSLTWLQDSDLLKNINAGEDSDISEEDGQKENDDGRKNGDGAGAGSFVPQTHPPHVPYNPLKHINSKPPYSFSCLIFMAIEDSPQKKLPVKDIYNWILTHFPYFQNAPTGWKNSVRHNLSLNKCFKKVEKDKGQSIGKGSLWCIDPDYRPNLLQALRKTPYHPYHQLQMMSTLPQSTHLTHLQGLPGGVRPMPLAQRPVPNTVSPHLFPFLSRRLAQTPCVIDSEMQDVANTLVAMKGFSSKNSSGMSSDGSDASGPTSARSMFKRKFGHGHKRHKGPIVCTLNPSEDHTYSATRVLEEDEASGTSSIDNEYDFGSGDEEEDDDDISEPSECPSDWDCGSGTDEVDGDVAFVPRKRLKIDLKARKDESSSKLDEEEEKKKDEEGAKALLNLAGIRMISSEPETKPSTPKSSPKSVPKMTFSSSKTVTTASKARRSSSKQSLSSRALSSSSPGRLLSSSKQSSTSAALSSSSPARLLSSKSVKSSSSKALLKSGSSVSSSLSTVTKPSSLTIMTRRGKAAAEAAALAAAPGVSTRGKKLSFS